MEKIIKGKIYNTAKSDKVAYCGIHNLELNLDELTEILYKTKKGEYFIYTYVCNIVSGEDKLGEDIKALNIVQILKWYEKRQKHFNDDEKKKFFKEFGRFFMEA